MVEKKAVAVVKKSTAVGGKVAASKATTPKVTATAVVKKAAAKTVKAPAVKKSAVPAAEKKPAAVKKAAAGVAVKKAPVKKGGAAAQLSASAGTASLQPTPEERYRMVETAAYFIAERQGFSGYAADHWAAAEREIALRLGK